MSVTLNEIVKMCPQCGVSKSIRSFGRDSSRLDGRYCYCKECRRKPNDRIAIEDELFARGLKICTKCRATKNLSGFDRDSTKRLGSASACKVCARMRRKELASSWHKIKQEHQDLFDQGLARCARCKKEKPLEDFLKSKISATRVYRCCKKCNIIYRSKRSPSKRNYARWNVFERDDFVCYLCGFQIDPNAKYPDPRSPSIDHVFPISKGGLDVFDNVRLACLHCNFNKRDLLLEDYLTFMDCSQFTNEPDWTDYTL